MKLLRLLWSLHSQHFPFHRLGPQMQKGRIIYMTGIIKARQTFDPASRNSLQKLEPVQNQTGGSNPLGARASPFWDKNRRTHADARC